MGRTQSRTRVGNHGRAALSSYAGGGDGMGYARTALTADVQSRTNVYAASAASLSCAPTI